jgi:hypothetical protein
MQAFTRQLRLEDSRNINLLANKMFLAGQNSEHALTQNSSAVSGRISKLKKSTLSGNLASEHHSNLVAEASKKSLGIHINLQNSPEEPGNSNQVEFLDKEAIPNDNDSNIDSLYQDPENEKIMFEDFDGGAEFDKEILTEEEFRRINNF